MRVTKEIALAQLRDELAAADVDVDYGLGSTGALETDDLDVFTYDESGAPVDLPPEAEAVIAAHVPEPPPPTKEQILQELLDSIDPDDLTSDAIAIMLLVQKEQLRP